jgi:hypothetical protein
MCGTVQHKAVAAVAERAQHGIVREGRLKGRCGSDQGCHVLINLHRTLTVPLTMLRAIIAPSLLAGDWGVLAAECNRMLELGADYLHMDIMDGCVAAVAAGANAWSDARDGTRQALCAEPDHGCADSQVPAQAHQGLSRCVQAPGRRASPRTHTRRTTCPCVDCHLMVSNPAQVRRVRPWHADTCELTVLLRVVVAWLRV